MVRRYKGATLSDESSGALIVYNNNTDVFTVNSGAPNSTAANPGGRVRTMLSPRVAAPATATPPAGPATVLRPSTSLGNVTPQKAP